MAHLGEPDTVAQHIAAQGKDVQWPWGEKGIGFSEKCWVGSAF